MKRVIAIVALLLCASPSFAQIEQALGVDQSVDYQSLVKYGPWDDRNYQLTKADLAVLPKNDQYLSQIPAFYKIAVRRHHNGTLGEFYPRSINQTFIMNHGGLLQHGVWNKTDRGQYYFPGDDPYAKPRAPLQKGAPLIPLNETPLETGVFGNETTVEYNPTNNNIAIAGSNANPGQTMYYSTDGGLTWTVSQVNENASCCDPTVDWSTDGSIAYQADLQREGAGANVRFSRSTDQGVTWAPMTNLTFGGQCDKEFIHSDRSTSSPHNDNVYLTWHCGNVMQFSRSVDMGLTYSTPVAFSGEPTGIGSDITTDRMGNVYYIYPSLSSATGIRLLKSTDGGATFAAGTQIAPLNGRFDFPVPAMESREVFIYVSADVDMSGGPNDGRIYVSWTDEADDSAGGGNGSAANNHGWIEVYYSDDQGATWVQMPKPHDTSDSLATTPIDRFHPWLKVSEAGAVHIGFYDTRHSVNRTGVDFYHNVSIDGSTWVGESRFTTETSVNINNGQEWGDYNGLSVVLDKIAMTWTDNRPSIGQTGMAGTATNNFGEPGFLISTPDAMQQVCTRDSAASFTAQLEVGSISGFTNDVTLAFNPALPAGFTSGFTVNPVTPPGNSAVDVDIDQTVAAGNYVLTVEGTATGADNRSVQIGVDVFDVEPAMPTQSLPANGATDQNTGAITFGWDALPNASSYILEIATDVGFSNIISTTTHSTNSATVSGVFEANTEYFWSVRGENICAGGPNSFIFSFTTANEICLAPGAPIPDFSAGTPGSLDSTNTVAGGDVLAGLTVSINAPHTWVGDLIFSLEHNGTSVLLMDRPGVPASQFGCSADNVDAIFDDASPIIVEDVCGTGPAIGGVVQPVDMLSSFAGANLAGDWTLTVSDNVGGDTGTLDSWCLIPVIDAASIFSDGFEN